MDYKLKNRDGAETTYTKDKIKIPAATGDSMVVFTQGEAQAEKTVDINANGAFTVEPDVGYAFIKKVSGTVAVPAPEPVLQEKSVNITSNGQTSVTPDAGKDGLSKITITTSVPGIIGGSVAKVVPLAFEMLKKAQNLPANPYGTILKHEVPVFAAILMQGKYFFLWGSLRFSEDNPTSDTLVWQSRVLPKEETKLGVDVWFVVQFPVKEGAVDTKNYNFRVFNTGDVAISATYLSSFCAAITDWLT